MTMWKRCATAVLGVRVRNVDLGLVWGNEKGEVQGVKV